MARRSSPNWSTLFGGVCAAVVAFAGADASAGEALPAVSAFAAVIDREIDGPLQARKITPSDPADDAEFIRRAHLDLHGVVPSADPAAAFLNESTADKRVRLIDELLASPRYGAHLADMWDELLVRPKPGDDLRRYNRIGLTKWLADSFNRNRPWNDIVGDLITATGHRDKNPPATYLTNGGLGQELNAADAAGSVSRLFLGVQLQCAECHDHPFTEWKQTEFWALAAFFSKTRRIGPWVLSEEGKGKVPKLPEHAKTVPAKFLGGETPTLDPDAPFRPPLARWLTAAENPFFAKAMVNRVWAQFFGRGLVNPIDDLHDGNSPSHPKLLQLLTDRFTAGGFDLKDLVRAIALTRAYQRTSRPTTGNKDDNKWYSHMAVKVLSGEQQYDSLLVILGEPPYPKNKKNSSDAPGPRAVFAGFYNPDRVDVDLTEYSRGVPQTLRSLNSTEFAANGTAVAAQVVREHPSVEARVDALYLRALSRKPDPPERERVVAFVRRQGDEAATYSQILWALLNTSEFSLNR